MLAAPGLHLRGGGMDGTCSWPGPRNLIKEQRYQGGREQKGQEHLLPGKTQKVSGSRQKGRKQRGLIGHYGRNVGLGRGVSSGSWPSGDSQGQTPPTTESVQSCAL